MRRELTVKVADFAAVVLTYGHQPGHERLVRALCDQGLRPGNISVIHNPILSGTEDERVADGVEIVRNATNKGYGSAINVGLQRPRVRRAPAVFVVADDVHVSDNTLERIAAGVSAHSDVGIFGVTLRLNTGELFSIGGRSGRGGMVGHIRTPGSVSPNGLAECDWVDAAAWTFRQDVLRDVGLLEERYFMYYEEPLICLKARRAGWRVGTILDAHAEQTPGAAKRPAAHAYLTARNGLHYAAIAAGLSGAAYAAQGFLRIAMRDHRLAQDHDLGPEERAVHALRRAGTLRGLGALAHSRWGPPPAMPGPSDILIVGAA